MFAIRVSVVILEAVNVETYPVVPIRFVDDRLDRKAVFAANVFVVSDDMFNVFTT